MSPPCQHIGFRQALLGQSVLRLIEGRGRDVKIAAFAQMIGNRLVHPARVELGHMRVLLLVTKFAPNGYSNGHGTHSISLRTNCHPERSEGSGTLTSDE